MKGLKLGACFDSHWPYLCPLSTATFRARYRSAPPFSREPSPTHRWRKNLRVLLVPADFTHALFIIYRNYSLYNYFLLSHELSAYGASVRELGCAFGSQMLDNIF